jgi:hypothetical protein
MPLKKKSPETFDSPFKSADKLFKEDKVKSENQKRFERWTDVIVREKKLPGNWKDDPEAEAKARWISGTSNVSPVQKKIKR